MIEEGLCMCGCGRQTELATRTRSEAGWVKGRPKRFLNGHNKRGTTHNRRHGHKPVSGPTPEYGIWCGIIQRCTNPNRPAYPRYGGRGITICDRWRTSFEAFYEDMGPRPSPEMSIDRIDNDGHYEPGNCRWATPVEQRANRRETAVVR